MDSNVKVFHSGRPALHRLCRLSQQKHEEVVLSVAGIATEVNLSPPMSHLSYVNKCIYIEQKHN